MNNQQHPQLWKQIFQQLTNNVDVNLIVENFVNCHASLNNDQLVISGGLLNIELLQKDYFEPLKKAVYEVLHFNPYLIFVESTKLSTKDVDNQVNLMNNPQESSVDYHYPIPESLKLLQFSNLVIHKNISSAIRIGREFLKSKQQICYVYGKNGAGKTHLSCALMNQYQLENPNKKCFYVDSSQLIIEYTNFYYQNPNKSDFFLEKYMDVDLLLIDDFQRFDSREEINNKLFTLVDYLLKRGAKIIIINHLKNKDLNNIDPSLKSRIQSGYTIKIDNPDQEAMKGLILDFLNKEVPNLKFDQESINYLVFLLGEDIRVVHGMLITICFYLRESQDILSIITKDKLLPIIELIDLKKTIAKSTRTQFDDQLVNLCKRLNFSLDLITSKARDAKIIERRNIIIYILKKEFKLTHQKIGELINRHHSTISNSLLRIEEQINLNQDYANYINSLIVKNL